MIDVAFLNDVIPVSGGAERLLVQTLVALDGDRFQADADRDPMGCGGCGVGRRGRRASGGSSEPAWAWSAFGEPAG